MSTVYLRGSRLKNKCFVAFRLNKHLNHLAVNTALNKLRDLLTPEIYRKTKTAAFELRVTTKIKDDKLQQLIFDRSLQELQQYYGSRLFASFTAKLGSKPCLYVYICPTPPIKNLELFDQDLWDSHLFISIAQDFNVMYDIALQQSCVFKLIEFINYGRR